MNNTNRAGILLLHGFAGDVEEIKPLREYLEQRGYMVECPLLPGHGLTKRELAVTSCEDWINAAERAYLDLSGKCDKLIVVGFSMGGLLAVNLWHYGFSGLVTVNMPIYYWNLKIIASNLFRDFHRFRKKYMNASLDKSFSSMVEFQKLLTKTKPMLRNVTCRTMIVQALDDDTVHYRSADYILKKIRAEKTVLRPEHGGHMIFQSDNGPEVCGRIERFAESLLTDSFRFTVRNHYDIFNNSFER